MTFIYIAAAGFFLWRAVYYFGKASEMNKLGKDKEKLDKLNDERSRREDEFFK